MSFCSWIKGMTLKIRMLCFVLINSILLNLLCIWILNNPASKISHIHGSCQSSNFARQQLLAFLFRSVSMTKTESQWASFHLHCKMKKSPFQTCFLSASRSCSTFQPVRSVTISTTPPPLPLQEKRKKAPSGLGRCK